MNPPGQLHVQFSSTKDPPFWHIVLHSFLHPVPFTSATTNKAVSTFFVTVLKVMVFIVIRFMFWCIPAICSWLSLHAAFFILALRVAPMRPSNSWLRVINVAKSKWKKTIFRSRRGM